MLSTSQVPDSTKQQLKRRKCAVAECFNNVSPLNCVLHTFPAVVRKGRVDEENEKRCLLWVKKSGNAVLLEKRIEKLNKYYYLCSQHFSDDQYFPNRKRLKLTAIPNQFECEPLTDIQMEEYRSKCFTTEEGTAENSDRNSIDVMSTDGAYVPAFIDRLFNGSQRDVHQELFEREMKLLKFVTCEDCKETFLANGKSKKKCIHGTGIMCANYTESNDMDPGEVPDELKNLTFIEEQLIAKIHPVVCVYKLKGQQYAYSGNIINLPQDVPSFAKTLPHLISDISSVVTIRTPGSDVICADFQVRSGRVRKALIWLKNNNRFYSDIEISEENLILIPEDGNVYNAIKKIEVASSDLSNNNENGEKTDDENGGYFVTESCVPSLVVPSQKTQIEIALDWPQVGSNPINEFTTEGYIAQAFPTLYSTGKADLRSFRHTEIKPSNYFKHMLRYHDGRFAKHPRFRYFALNSVMRWTALNDGSVFINKNAEFQNLTSAGLRNKLKQDRNLIKKIMFNASNLRGTKQYWNTRGKQLKSMIEQLGLPTIFITLSAADLHWPDLFRLFDPDADLNSMTESRRRKLVQENPILVDSFFMQRVETFFHDVLKPKYQIEDMWYRIEFQHRGSPHLHGLLWLKEAPDRINLENFTEEDLDKIAEYYDKVICTVHPDMDAAPAQKHPCRLRFSEIMNVKEDCAELLNRVQQHTKCTDGYCVRTNKKTRVKECRFKFPKSVHESKSKIQKGEDGEWEFLSTRNDPRLNRYNPYIIQSWRANIDVSPVLSKKALISYLAKYISKSEVKSADLEGMIEAVFNKTEDEEKAAKVVKSLYVKSLSDRDYSAQEVGHLIMGHALYSSGGRNFVSVNFRNEDEWIQVSSNAYNKARSIFEKYQDRPPEYHTLSLWNMAKFYNMSSMKKLKKPAIVQVYPVLRAKDGNENEDYFKQQVLLHVPWKDIASLKGDNSWQELYHIHQNDIQRQDHCDLGCVESSTNEVEYDEIVGDDQVPLEDWEQLSRMGSSMLVEETQLGRREIDLQFNWNASSSKYDYLGGITVLKQFITEKKATDNTSAERVVPENVVLTDEQKAVIDNLELQIKVIKNETSLNNNIPKRIIVQGKAGTGKSLLINIMAERINTEFEQESLLILAPTGVAAMSIGGQTIHSKLRIKKRNFSGEHLSGAEARKFINDMESVKFLFIDEYSMVGCTMLDIVDQRCRQGKEDAQNYFGDLFVYLFGDIQQLPPVMDTAIYSNKDINKKKNSAQILRGKDIFHNFERCFELTTVKRQNDASFQQILNNVGEGKVTLEDVNSLATRFTTHVCQESHKNFLDAIHLYPIRDLVDKRNNSVLRNLKSEGSFVPQPVARIPAINSCETASNKSADGAEGLEPVLYFAVGAKIMLTCNLWTTKGLVNGSIGQIVDIIYDEDCSSPEDQPAIIVCRFFNYTGPSLDENNSFKIVPITPLTRHWTGENGEQCSRTQYPLRLCYACTIHKAQGLTLEKVYIDLGKRESHPGLSYVALSRAKTFEGLLLQPFSSKRLMHINNSTAISERKNLLQTMKSKVCFKFRSKIQQCLLD